MIIRDFFLFLFKSGFFNKMVKNWGSRVVVGKIIGGNDFNSLILII